MSASCNLKWWMLRSEWNHQGKRKTHTPQRLSGLADWSDLCGRVAEKCGESKGCQLTSLTWEKTVLLMILTNGRSRYRDRDLGEDGEFPVGGLILSCWRHPKKMHSRKLGMSGGLVLSPRWQHTLKPWWEMRSSR